MVRSVAVVLVLSLPAVARADGAPFPGFRDIGVAVDLMVDQEYPDYEFFLVSWNVERLPLSPTAPVHLSPENRNGPGRTGSVYAVTKGQLAPFGDAFPPREWFSQPKSKEVVWLGTLSFRGTVLLTDVRSRGEVTYRVELDENGGRLVKVSERSGHLWLTALAVVGAIGLGVWGVRRQRRPKPA